MRLGLTSGGLEVAAYRWLRSLLNPKIPNYSLSYPYDHGQRFLRPPAVGTDQSTGGNSTTCPPPCLPSQTLRQRLCTLLHTCKGFGHQETSEIALRHAITALDGRRFLASTLRVTLRWGHPLTETPHRAPAHNHHGTKKHPPPGISRQRTSVAPLSLKRRPRYYRLCDIPLAYSTSF